jgi:hypothetical protein
MSDSLSRGVIRISQATTSFGSERVSASSWHCCPEWLRAAGRTTPELQVRQPGGVDRHDRRRHDPVLQLDVEAELDLTW